MDIFENKLDLLILPLLVFFSLFIHKKENKKISNLYPFLIGAFVLCVLWFFLRRVALYGANGLTFVSMFKSVFFNTPAIVQFIGKIFLPFNAS